MAAAKAGDCVAELVKDAIALTGAKLIDGLEGGLVLWTIPGRPGSWSTAALIDIAIEMLGRAAWQ